MSQEAVTDVQIFISTPISTISAASLKQLADLVRSLVNEILLQGANCKYFCAALDTQDALGLDDPADSALRDFNEIAKSDIFLLIYPEVTASSALVELGFAIALGLPVIFFSPNRETLPFIVRLLDKSLVGEAFYFNNTGETVSMLVEQIGKRLRLQNLLQTS